MEGSMYPSGTKLENETLRKALNGQQVAPLSQTRSAMASDRMLKDFPRQGSAANDSEAPVRISSVDVPTKSDPDPPSEERRAPCTETSRLKPTGGARSPSPSVSAPAW